MAALSSPLPELRNSLHGVIILEAPAGALRDQWIEDRLRDASASGSRVFNVSCDFDSGGPWAGVSGLLADLFPEIQSERPDLVQRHSLELVYTLPQVRRMLTVNNPTLTDLSSNEERVRSYPADRAFRIIHGIVELLDHWKTTSSPDVPWTIACNGYDQAGAMSGRFFKELMRRRGASLRISLLIAVEKGEGEETENLFRSSTADVSLVSLDFPSGPKLEPEPAVAAELASQIEQRIGEDRIATQIHLPELIRLWRQAGRPDKVLQCKWFGLETYNTLGLYADAIRYGDGILELALKMQPQDKAFHWSIMVKLLNAHIGLQDAAMTLKLAHGIATELAEPVAAWRSYLFYMLAMLYARYQKPRDLVKGEEYLDRGLAALEESDLPEQDYHFQSVFNRNGLAMVRNFQGRHTEAIELCRSCLARLNAHLSADQHRLHRSVLLYNIGQVYMALGAFDEALEHYASAMAMDPNYSEYYNERGNIYLQLGRLEEAQANYLKAIELSPPYFEVFTNLGQCYRRMGTLPDAIEAYSHAIDIEPTHVLALLGRAKAYEDLGQQKEAIADYTAAIAQDPALWEAIASRAVIHYESGDLAAALADLNCAIRINGNRGELYENRATVLLDLGQRDNAVRDLEAAISHAVSAEEKLAIESRLRSVQ